MTKPFFDDPLFNQFLDDIYDTSTALNGQVGRFAKRLKQSKTAIDVKKVVTEEDGVNDGIIFYLPTLVMGDSLLFDEAFTPEQISASKLYLDVSYTPIQKSVTYLNMLMTLRPAYQRVQLDVIQDQHATERIYGGIQSAGEAGSPLGVTMPLVVPFAGKQFLLRVAEHWQIANKDLRPVCVEMERYFVVDWQAESDGTPPVVGLNAKLADTRPDTITPFMRELVKHDPVELENYVDLLNTPKYFEKPGMFVNYHGAIQFGLSKKAIEATSQDSPLSTYNLEVNDSGFEGPEQMMPPKIHFHSFREVCQRLAQRSES